MIGKSERQRDILKVIETLDITPSMYKNADEKYHALADYLSRHTDFTLDMYPQGSFAFGTVVRPFKNDEDGSYDLDFICEVDLEKGDITAEELRDSIDKAISDGELYGGKLMVSDQCLTIQYSEEGGAAFSIDIVPAARESERIINGIGFILVRFVTRIAEYIKYHDVSVKISAMYEFSSKNVTLEKIEELQKHINTLRHVPVFGINIIHKKSAHLLTEQYRNINRN